MQPCPGVHTNALEGPVHGPVRKNEALYEVHGAPLGADHSLHHAEVLFRIAHVNGQNADVPDGQHHVVMLWRMLRAFKIALKMPDVLRTSRLRGSNLQDDSSRTQTCWAPLSYLTSVNWHKSDRNQVHFILSAHWPPDQVPRAGAWKCQELEVDFARLERDLHRRRDGGHRPLLFKDACQLATLPPKPDGANDTVEKIQELRRRMFHYDPTLDVLAPADTQPAGRPADKPRRHRPRKVKSPVRPKIPVGLAFGAGRVEPTG